MQEELCLLDYCTTTKEVVNFIMVISLIAVVIWMMRNQKHRNQEGDGDFYDDYDSGDFDGDD